MTENTDRSDGPSLVFPSRYSRSPAAEVTFGKTTRILVRSHEGHIARFVESPDPLVAYREAFAICSSNPHWMATRWLKWDIKQKLSDGPVPGHRKAHRMRREADHYAGLWADFRDAADLFRQQAENQGVCR